MAYQVSRADTGQFVLTDPRSGTVVVDEDLAAGFDKLDRSVTQASSSDASSADPQARDSDAATGSSAPTLGGSRATLIGLAVVLPFAWLAVFYFALSNLLGELAIDREATKATKTRLQELEREVQALRSELAGAPRTEKTRANVRKQKPKTEEPETEEPDTDEPDADPDAGETEAETETEAEADAEADAPRRAPRPGLESRSVGETKAEGEPG